MADVFISHHTDSAGEIAVKIHDALEKEGISCFVAQRDIKGGVYAEEIAEALENCKIFLLLLNKKSQNSTYVLNEISIAVKRHDHQKDIEILPVKIGDFQLNRKINIFISAIQIHDGTQLPRAEALKDLTKKIKVLLVNLKRKRIENSWVLKAIRNLKEEIALILQVTRDAKIQKRNGLAKKGAEKNQTSSARRTTKKSAETKMTKKEIVFIIVLILSLMIAFTITLIMAIAWFKYYAVDYDFLVKVFGEMLGKTLGNALAIVLMFILWGIIFILIGSFIYIIAIILLDKLAQKLGFHELNDWIFHK